MTTDCKAIVTRWFEEIWNQGRHRIIDEVMAATCLTKVEGIDAPLTRDDFKRYHEAFRSAVPDLRAEVLFVVAEGEKVIANWRARGTHLGPGLGIPPSRGRSRLHRHERV